MIDVAGSRKFMLLRFQHIRGSADTVMLPGRQYSQPLLLSKAVALLLPLHAVACPTHPAAVFFPYLTFELDLIFFFLLGFFQKRDLIHELLFYAAPVGIIFQLKEDDFLTDDGISIPFLAELVVFTLPVIDGGSGK